MWNCFVSSFIVFQSDHQRCCIWFLNGSSADGREVAAEKGDRRRRLENPTRLRRGGGQSTAVHFEQQRRIASVSEEYKRKERNRQTKRKKNLKEKARFFYLYAICFEGFVIRSFDCLWWRRGIDTAYHVLFRPVSWLYFAVFCRLFLSFIYCSFVSVCRLYLSFSFTLHCFVLFLLLNISLIFWCYSSKNSRGGRRASVMMTSSIEEEWETERPRFLQCKKKRKTN